ncbi:MAG TPA: hypothetical protein VF546_24425 [Pyrinomonadaceae bacterium]
MPKPFAACAVLLALFAAPGRTAPAPNAAPAPQGADVAIIVNQKNQTRDLSFNNLRKLFMAERGQWPDGTKVVVAMRQPAGQPEREAVLRAVYNWNEDYYRTYFRQGRFNESITTVPRELNSTYAMIQYVHYTPGAIGYVRADQVDYSKVNVLSVDGRKPGEAGYRIR